MSARHSTKRLFAGAAAICLAIVTGCARGPDITYGVTRGASLNGTSVFEAMLQERGFQTRVALRLTTELEEWAKGIVRFAPYPGPPAKDEADWFRSWLARDRTRWLIYVVRDFDTTAEYWAQIRDGISEKDDPARRAIAEENRASAENWVTDLPLKAKDAAPRATWFTTDTPVSPPRVCTTLSGEWAAGVDAQAAALTVHEPLNSNAGHVLLEGDGKPIVIMKRAGQPNVLLVASGTFLLNGALVNPARRPLAERVADWPDNIGDHVALVEGAFLLDGDKAPSLFDLLARLPGLRWAAIQVGLAALFAALARAPRLGRPRPEPVSGADRPAAHAEALGSLLEQTGDALAARELLARYHQWRNPHTPREPARTSGRAHPPQRAARSQPPKQEADAPSAQPAAPARDRNQPA
jgi:hypothetical protein